MRRVLCVSNASVCMVNEQMWRTFGRRLTICTGPSSASLAGQTPRWRTKWVAEVPSWRTGYGEGRRSVQKRTGASRPPPAAICQCWSPSPLFRRCIPPAAAVTVNVWQARGGPRAAARETLLVPVWWAEPADDTAGGGPVNEFSHTGTKRRRGAAGLVRRPGVSRPNRSSGHSDMNSVCVCSRDCV